MPNNPKPNPFNSKANSKLDLKHDQQMEDEFIVTVEGDEPADERQLSAEVDTDDAKAIVLDAETEDGNDANDDQPAGRQTASRPNRFKRLLHGYGHHKKWTIPLTVVLLLTALAAIPWSRYLVAGQFVQRTYTVQLNDTATHKPVSGAKLTINGSTSSVTTDAKGQATLRAKVGKRQLVVDKKYYNSYITSVFVGLGKQKQTAQLQLVATGRQVPISVTDKISGKPIANASLEAVGTNVKTDKDGKATIVLPADKASLTGTLIAQGYNDAQLTIKITDAADKANDYQLTPSGKIYFLSKLSGKIDVVKTDLDGSNRQTVLPGSGKEEDGNTVLLASRDWHYLALLAKRSSDLPKLYLIDTASDKLTVMDEGDAGFSLIGWSGSNFAYSVTRNSVQQWQPNRVAVKTFNADKKQITTVDQNDAQGDSNNYMTQSFSSFYLINDKLVYATDWPSYITLAGADHFNTIREVTVGSQTKKDLKTFQSVTNYFQQAIPYEPGSVYFSNYSQADSKTIYYEYEDGQVSQEDDVPDDVTGNAYPTYLTSPSGKQAFWSEERDGRDTFFVGGADASNPKQVAVLDDYAVYGWYTDNYLLVSKKGSELYIMPVAGGTQLKVTDYHKPQISYRGYGGGYGGL